METTTAPKTDLFQASSFLPGTPVIIDGTRVAAIIGVPDGYPKIEDGALIDGSFPVKLRVDKQADPVVRLVRDLKAVTINLRPLPLAGSDNLEACDPSQLIWINIPEQVINAMVASVQSKVDAGELGPGEHPDPTVFNHRVAYICDAYTDDTLSDGFHNGVLHVHLLGDLPNGWKDTVELSPNMIAPLANYISYGEADFQARRVAWQDTIDKTGAYDPYGDHERDIDPSHVLMGDMAHAEPGESASDYIEREFAKLTGGKLSRERSAEFKKFLNQSIPDAVADVVKHERELAAGYRAKLAMLEEKSESEKMIESLEALMPMLLKAAEAAGDESARDDAAQIQKMMAEQATYYADKREAADAMKLLAEGHERLANVIERQKAPKEVEGMSLKQALEKMNEISKK